MQSTSEWDRFPVERISPATFLKRNLIHHELLRAVARRARGADSSVLEVGIGSGAQSAWLSRGGRATVSLDNDWRILTACAPNLERYGRNVRRVAADAFRMPFPNGSFEVALSQGLMEHFSNDDIVRLIREQLRVARSVVFSVPSDRYPRQDVGNERLLSPDRWREILTAAVDPARHELRTSYYRVDVEAAKYSLLARRWLGSFSVLVTIDPRGDRGSEPAGR